MSCVVEFVALVAAGREVCAGASRSAPPAAARKSTAFQTIRSRIASSCRPRQRPASSCRQPPQQRRPEPACRRSQLPPPHRAASRRPCRAGAGMSGGGRGHGVVPAGTVARARRDRLGAASADAGVAPGRGSCRRLHRRRRSATAKAPASAARNRACMWCAGRHADEDRAHVRHQSLTEIAKLNNIAPHAKLKIGDQINVPGAQRARSRARSRRKVRAAAQARSRSESRQPLAKAQPKRGAPCRRRRDRRPSRSTAAPMRRRRARSARPAACPTFRWPVRGRVIAGFGPKTNGQQNDGINLAVPEGTPVKAAEDGVVAYAGNELKGYGNLVLVRHANGYVTAYAHAKRIAGQARRPDQARADHRALRPDRQRQRAATALRDPQGPDAGRSDAVSSSGG